MPNLLPSYQYWFIVLSFFFHRAYLDVKELKDILQLDGSTHLNIFFANSSDEELAGVATWPWDKEALTHLGRKQKHARMQSHTSTACVFFFIIQAELCWILPSTARLVTLTLWSTRSVTVLAFTMCFEAYRRWNRVTTLVWRRSPRWKLEICVQTPTPLPNTKAATIPIRAMKPVGAGTSRTRPSTTTWVMLVSYKPTVHTLPFRSRFSLNDLCCPQMTPAPTPLPWTRWRGCTVTWTSFTRPGSHCPNPLWYRCRRKWSTSIIIPSPWNGFIPSRDTFITGEMSSICMWERIKRNLEHLAAPWNVVQPTWCAFGLYLSCLLCLSVGFLEKWDQCVINALRGGFCSSMPPILSPPDPATPLDTGPLERLKVWYQTYLQMLL